MVDSAVAPIQSFEPVAAPTPRPSNVRFATPADFDRIYALLLELYAENGALPIAPQKVERKLADLLSGDPARGLGTVGVIDGAFDDIAAAIGLGVEAAWYTDWFSVIEYWSTVRLAYRRSTFAKDILTFAKHFADGLGLPLMVGITTTKRTEAKIRLYQRHLTLIGASFAHNIRLAGGPLAKEAGDV